MVRPRVLALDAMGVIYPIRSLGKELLLPFIAAHGGRADRDLVKDLYKRASLGRLPADDFWRGVGLDPALEEACLEGHRPAAGLVSFLDWAQATYERIYVLSNDVSRWSLRTRRRHGLEGRFDGWLVSGDLGFRKPDPAIYHALIAEAGLPPETIVFVDDRESNLDAAAALGLRTVLLDAEGASERHLVVPNLPGLRQLLETG